jgi:hypothetical protein
VSDAHRTIARWGNGGELPADDLVALARVAEARPGALDDELVQLTGIRRRALSRRLRELAAEAIPDHETVVELADRIEELPDRLLISPEQERRLLAHLLAVGAQTEKQLADALGPGVDIAEQRISQWADDAADRGLIEAAEPGSAIRRWHISDRGRAVLGVPSAL